MPLNPNQLINQSINQSMVALTETVSVLHVSVAHRVYYNGVGGVAQWLRRSLAGGLFLICARSMVDR